MFTKYVVTEQENNDKFNELKAEPQMEQHWTGGFMILSAIYRAADCCSILNVTHYPLLIANYLQVCKICSNNTDSSEATLRQLGSLISLQRSR